MLINYINTLFSWSRSKIPRNSCLIKYLLCHTKFSPRAIFPRLHNLIFSFYIDLVLHLMYLLRIEMEMYKTPASNRKRRIKPFKLTFSTDLTQALKFRSGLTLQTSTTSFLITSQSQIVRKVSCIRFLLCTVCLQNVGDQGSLLLPFPL